MLQQRLLAPAAAAGVQMTFGALEAAWRWLSQQCLTVQGQRRLPGRQQALLGLMREVLQRPRRGSAHWQAKEQLSPHPVPALPLPQPLHPLPLPSIEWLCLLLQLAPAPALAVQERQRRPLRQLVLWEQRVPQQLHWVHRLTLVQVQQREAAEWAPPPPLQPPQPVQQHRQRVTLPGPVQQPVQQQVQPRARPWLQPPAKQSAWWLPPQVAGALCLQGRALAAPLWVRRVAWLPQPLSLRRWGRYRPCLRRQRGRVCRLLPLLLHWQWQRQKVCWWLLSRWHWLQRLHRLQRQQHGTQRWQRVYHQQRQRQRQRLWRVQGVTALLPGRRSGCRPCYPLRQVPPPVARGTSCGAVRAAHWGLSPGLKLRLPGWGWRWRSRLGRLRGACLWGRGWPACRARPAWRRLQLTPASLLLVECW